MERRPAASSIGSVTGQAGIAAAVKEAARQPANGTRRNRKSGKPGRVICHIASSLPGLPPKNASILSPIPSLQAAGPAPPRHQRTTAFNAALPFSFDKRTT